MYLLIAEQELYKKDPDRQVGHHSKESEVMSSESLAVADELPVPGHHRHAVVSRASGLYDVISESTCSDKIFLCIFRIRKCDGFCWRNLFCRIWLRVSCVVRRLCVLGVTRLQIDRTKDTIEGL